MMQRVISIAGMMATVFGFAPAGLAQSEMTPSPAEILGVQERSYQSNPVVNRTTPSVNSSQPIAPANEGGLVLYRIDRNTRVLVGPVRGTAPLSDLPAQSQQGDNRLQLLRDLEE
jgi:hypothetical protein